MFVSAPNKNDEMMKKYDFPATDHQILIMRLILPFCRVKYSTLWGAQSPALRVKLMLNWQRLKAAKMPLKPIEMDRLTKRQFSR